MNFLTGMQIFCDDSSLIITDLVLWTQVQRCPSAAILVGFDEKNDQAKYKTRTVTENGLQIQILSGKCGR